MTRESGEGESQEKSVQEFRGFRVGEPVNWIDARTKAQFSIPAFGYGEGPFELLKINVTPWAKLDAPKFGNNVMLTVDTPKGLKALSADHFKPD